MTEQDLIQIATWLFLYVFGLAIFAGLIEWWEGRKNNFDDY